MNTTLLIMAAGLGSRYGGNKQIDRIGPNGEILMEYSIHDAVEAGFDKVVFSLSVWLYQSIQRYHARHKYSAIIENAKIQNVISNKGDSDQTFLDTMLSMLRFHKDHQNLFTYISIVNTSGNNKIHWGKTMSKVQPLIRNDVPFYAEFRNKNKTINYDEDIIILFYSCISINQFKFNVTFTIIEFSIIFFFK